MTFGIIGNIAKENVGEGVGKLLRLLRKMGVDYVLDTQLVSQVPDALHQEGTTHCFPLDVCVKKADMVVAFGGDGTILSAARQAGPMGKPILGINLGKLGFLAEIAPEELESAIHDIVNGKFVTEERLVLHAEFPNSQAPPIHALNDVVINKSGYSSLIDLETYINGDFAVTYRADGLVISTPTGSTAYALSNGGPIVIPTSAVIGITPIAPHTLSGRPLVVPDGSIIRVVVHSTHEVAFFADGVKADHRGSQGEIVIKRAGHAVKLVKWVDKTYFEVLRAKLLWGQDARRT